MRAIENYRGIQMPPLRYKLFAKGLVLLCGKLSILFVVLC